MAGGAKKPELCTHPDCFSCPYEDCQYDYLTEDEYIKSNQRDRECRSLCEYKQRSYDCSGRKEYYRKRYQEDRERKLTVSRRYRRRTDYKDSRDRSEYYKNYYQRHKAEKSAKALERYHQIKEAMIDATG